MIPARALLHPTPEVGELEEVRRGTTRAELARVPHTTTPEGEDA